MITLDQLQLQAQGVLGLTLVLSVLMGALFHRGHFCTMGAISDWVIMGDAHRAKQWAMAVAVAVLGFGLMSWLGWVTPGNTIYANTQIPWLSLLLGGAIFGSGMVLGSGCTSKSLVRLGGGNLKSLVVLMAMGISALATLRGLTAVWRVNSIDLVTVDSGMGAFLGQWFSHVTHIAQPWSNLLSAFAVASLLFLWVFKDRRTLGRSAILSGAGIGGAVVLLWWVSGVLGYVPEHPQTLEPVFLATASGRMEAMSLTAPVAYGWDALMYFSDGGKRVTTGMVMVMGVLLGAFCSAQWQGTFRWEGFTQTADLGRHLLGGALMGIGAVMAMGCSIGQGLSGLSTLSLGSGLAVIGIVLGAVLTLRWEMHRAELLA